MKTESLRNVQFNNQAFLLNFYKFYLFLTHVQKQNRKGQDSEMDIDLEIKMLLIVNLPFFKDSTYLHFLNEKRIIFETL